MNWVTENEIYKAVAANKLHDQKRNTKIREELGARGITKKLAKCRP